MIHEIINLRPENQDITLETFVTSSNDGIAPRSAILVCPGGAYAHLADHEGEKIALQYFAAGINAFVLKYSVAENTKNLTYPMALVDASNAMKYIKDNAERYNINPDKVFVLGFSAGGHLASMLGTVWHRPEVYENAQPMEYGYNKPAGMILCYPVITGSEHGHKATFRNLYGKDPSEEEIAYCSSELNVDERTCPAFLWHTSKDNAVSVDNTLLMASALNRQKIPFEVHIYPFGDHGYGYPDEYGKRGEDSHIATWMKLSIEWIKKCN